jgi:hypothetical protein
MKTRTKKSRKGKRRNTGNGKLGHVRVSHRNGDLDGEFGHVQISDEITHRPLSEIRPSPENDKLYKRIDTNDSDFRAFAEQVRTNGITDPLIITHDGYICSGHRRYAAADYIGLESVPCRTMTIPDSCCSCETAIGNE